MKLNVKKDYIIYKFFTYGLDDAFDYFYYRNNKMFKKNLFYEKVMKDFYDDDKYPTIEKELINARIITNNCLMLPKGVHELTITRQTKIVNELSFECSVLWELNINGVIITGLRNFLDEDDWRYDDKIKDYIQIYD